MRRYGLHITSFFVGVLMAAGLAVAGMTRPHKVVAFLDAFGDWEPDLMLVMGAALVTTFVAYRWVLKRRTPLLGGRFLVPTRRDIDGRLLVGAGVFGVGWGLTGICPGPALVSLPTLSPGILVFLVGMTVGMGLLNLYERSTALRRRPSLTTTAPVAATRTAQTRNEGQVAS